MKPRLSLRERIRRLIADGAEHAKLAVIPGGKERRKTPRTSGPRLMPENWHDADGQRLMDEQYRAAHEPPPAA